MGKKFGFSFSWKRALGISAAKGKLSRKLGVPLTRSGRERKLGRWLLGGSKAGKSAHAEGDTDTGDGVGIGWVGMLIIVALVWFGVSRLFKNSSAPSPTKDMPAAIAAVPADSKPAANASSIQTAKMLRPIPTGATAVAAQQRAITKFPELGVKDSPLNRAFIDHVRRHQADKPEVFDDPEWPTIIATKAATSLK